MESVLETAKCYEQCRALISVLSEDRMDEADRAALLWLLQDCFERLGDAIGMTPLK